MSVGLLTAGSGQRWENDLVAALDRPGAALTVVRRCVDIADVIAEASTGAVTVAVVAADLRRLDSEAVRRLRSAGVALIVVYPAADPRAPIRLDRIGVENAVSDDIGADALLAAVQSAALLRPSGSPAEDPGLADPRAALPPGGRGDDPEPGAAPPDPHPSGRVVAVWGPTGAPGRTTVAAGLAVGAARADIPTLLIDGDVYGGVLASAFGLLDESPGLAGACRLAANGRLDLAELTRLVWSVGPGLRLLTGIARADRWPELRPSAIPGVLTVARSMAPLVVVDLGFALEADEEITFDSMAPRRNGATLAVLQEADAVVAVGSADPPGMERLIRGLSELADCAPSIRPQVVVNRLRRSAASAAEVAQAITRFAGLTLAGTVPEDRPATDKAWRDGVPLAVAAPGSAMVAAFDDLARRLAVGAPSTPSTARG